MAILLVSTLGFAQIQKGDIQITGNVGYNKTRPYITQVVTRETSRITISSKAGVFLSETTSLGGILGFSSLKPQDLTIFNVGAYARFHNPVAENFYLYLETFFLLWIFKLKRYLRYNRRQAIARNDLLYVTKICP